MCVQPHLPSLYFYAAAYSSAFLAAEKDQRKTVSKESQLTTQLNDVLETLKPRDDSQLETYLTSFCLYQDYY